MHQAVFNFDETTVLFINNNAFIINFDLAAIPFFHAYPTRTDTHFIAGFMINHVNPVRTDIVCVFHLIAFQVDHHSADGELGGLHTLAGLPLTRACAAALLAPQGGCVEVSEKEGSTRVSFVVPASPPSRQ